MLKIAAIVSLMLIGSTLSTSLPCDSCGSECTSACGTRRFRLCCFNYLRRKRGPEAVKYNFPTHDVEMENQPKEKLPMFVVEYLAPEQWYADMMSGDIKSSPVQDMFE